MRAVCSAYLSCLTREDDFGAVDERDVITEFLDALHVVGGEHEGRSLGLEGKDLALEYLSIYGVKATEWLIEDQQAGLMHDGRDELDLLLHPLRELFDALVPP